MSVENYAAVLHGPSDLRIEKWPMPEIDDNEVLVKMMCVGICGSDVQLFTAGRCGLEQLPAPIVIGHEGAGVVVQVGAQVTGFRAGDRVAIEPTQPCRGCGACRRGRYNLCARPRYCATAQQPGNLCRYYKHVADFCHKIPDNLTFEDGAAVQPLAIAIHAVRRASPALGDSLAVLGAGPVGLLCALAAKAMGVTHILIADVLESRLKTAAEMGIEMRQLISLGQSEREVSAGIVAALGARPHAVIDACGAPLAQAVAMMVRSEREVSAGIVAALGARPHAVIDACGAPLAQAVAMMVRSEREVSAGIVAALGARPHAVIDACGAPLAQAVAMMVRSEREVSAGIVAALGARPHAVIDACGAPLAQAVAMMVRSEREVSAGIVAALGARPHAVIDACGAPLAQAVAMMVRSEREVSAGIVAALGARPHAVIDACGAPLAQAVAMMTPAAGGAAVLVGIGPPRVEVPLAAAMLREVDLLGSYRIANTYPAALAAVSSGAIDLSRFITHTFPLEKTREALELAKSGAAMKIIIHTNM